MPRRLWSETFGTRAHGDRPSSVVTVYERADAPGRIYMTRAWKQGKDRVQPLKHGTTPEGAIALAKLTAAKREKLIAEGLTTTGEAREATLFRLLEEYHGPRNRRARDWSERHRAEQDRCRRFWCRALGDVPVAALRQGTVEGVAADAAEARDWAGRTEAKYLKYLKAATRFGRRKLGLYDRDPLEGLDLPEERSDTRRLIYTRSEARQLCTPHSDVDWRVTLAASIAVDTGRRLSAIRHLWAGLGPQDDESDLAVLSTRLLDPESGDSREVEVMVLHFRPEFDKGGRDMWVPVSSHTRELVEEALDTAAVAGCGWLLPEGRLGYQDPCDQPVGGSALVKMLHAAERALDIETRKGRAFHALKRLHVTVGSEEAGGDMGLVSHVTGNRSEEVLKDRYRFAQLRQMLPQVVGVHRRIFAEDGDDLDTIEGAMRRRNTDMKTDRPEDA